MDLKRHCMTHVNSNETIYLKLDRRLEMPEVNPVELTGFVPIGVWSLELQSADPPRIDDGWDPQLSLLMPFVAPLVKAFGPVRFELLMASLCCIKRRLSSFMTLTTWHSDSMSLCPWFHRVFVVHTFLVSLSKLANRSALAWILSNLTTEM